MSGLVGELGGEELHTGDIGSVANKVGERTGRFLLSYGTKPELRDQRRLQWAWAAHPIGDAYVWPMTIGQAREGSLGYRVQPVGQRALTRGQLERSGSLEQARGPVQVRLDRDCRLGY